MIEIIIDFNKISEETGKKLFAGKENGKQGQILFGFNKSGKDTIFDIRMESGVAISSSYYLGLFKEKIIILSSENEFLAKVYLNGKKYQRGTLPELDRAVRRVFRDY